MCHRLHDLLGQLGMPLGQVGGGGEQGAPVPHPGRTHGCRDGRFRRCQRGPGIPPGQEKESPDEASARLKHRILDERRGTGRRVEERLGLVEFVAVDVHGGQDQGAGAGPGPLGQAVVLRLACRRPGLVFRPAGPAVEVVDQGQVAEGLPPGQRHRRSARVFGDRRQRGPGGAETPCPQAGGTEVGEHQGADFRVFVEELPGEVRLEDSRLLGGAFRSARRSRQPSRQGFQQGAAEPARRGVGPVPGQLLLGPAQVGQAVIEIVPGQFACRADEVRRRARGLGAHPCEQGGQVLRAQTGEELPDREVVDDGAGGEVPVVGRRALDECLVQGSGPAQPPSGPAAQFRLEAGETLPQVSAEDLREEGMQAVPRVAEVVDEGVLAVQRGQDRFRVGPQRQRVHQVGAEAFQDADAQQQVLGGGGLPVQHLGQQEVGHRAVVGFELLQVGLGVRSLPGGQCAQAEARCPSLGPPHQCRHGARRQVQAVARQQLLGFLGGEGQLGVPDLRELARRTVAVQGQQGFRAGDEDQAHAASGMAQHELQLLRDLGRGHPVELVEDDDGGVVPALEVGGEAGQRPLVHTAGLRRAADVARHGDAGGPQRLQQIRPEDTGGLVRGVGGEPGDGFAQSGGPVGDQEGLARAGRPVDHRQGRHESPVEVPYQTGPAQERHGPLRQGETGAQQRVTRGVDSRERRLRTSRVGRGHGVHHRLPSVGARAVLVSLSISAFPPPCTRTPVQARAGRPRAVRGEGPGRPGT